MNTRQRIKALVAHFKIDVKAHANDAALLKAVKAAAKMPYDSIEVVYDKVLGSAKAPVVIDGKATEVKPSPPVTEPSAKAVTSSATEARSAEGVSQRVELTAPAPTLNVHVPAPVVNTTYGAGQATWTAALFRVAAYAFVYVSGGMTGAGLVLYLLVSHGVLRLGAA